MTPFDPARRGRGSRTLVPVLVVLLGVALGVGGVVLLRSVTGSAPGRPAAASPPARASASAPAPARAPDRTRAAGQAASRPSDRAVYARIVPSVVDVTSTLRYDDETASGTGFVIDGGRGLVLTNNHVIRDATMVRVTLPATGRSYPARIVGVDVPGDIAVLKLASAPRLPAVQVGDSARLTPGMPVLAIGNQAGAGGSPAIAPGVLSATGRTILADDGTTGYTETLHGMLQVTARIQPGDSGGPLADTAGQVIGVDTAAGTGSAAAGYAIPIGSALRTARLIAAGRLGPGITLGVGGFLGVVLPSTTATSPRQQQAQEHGLAAAAVGAHSPAACLSTQASARVPAKIAPVRAGALVDGVLCGTAAAAAGIAPGDVITAADGQRVSSPDALTALISARRPGSLLAITWVAVAGSTRTAVVRLDAAPAALPRPPSRAHARCRRGIWR